MNNSMFSDDIDWPEANTFVRLIDGNILAGTYVGVNEVHAVKHGSLSTSITTHWWRLTDGRMVLCVHPIGDGINRPMEIKREMA
jgi:hypothetical protein